MNPATKVSTVLIVTLSFLCLVEGLICNVCQSANNGKCQRGKKQCAAQPGQSCASISIYKGSTHMFNKQLCMSDCKDDTISNNRMKMFVMCCKKNLCNSF